MSEKGYVLVWEHDGQTTQLPKPPPPPEKDKMAQNLAALGRTISPGKNFSPAYINRTMPHRRHKKAKGKRKKVIRKGGKRYYRAGKSGLVRLKGGKKPPKRRR